MINGGTGTGKNLLALAWGIRLVHKDTRGHTIIFQKLLLKTKMSRIDGTVHKFINKLTEENLLILGDFGLSHLEQQQRMDQEKIDHYSAVS